MKSDKGESNKALELIQLLKSFSIPEVLDIEEHYDEQFKALKKLYECVRNCSVYLSLIVLNALSSYMLNCTGEMYWKEFADYFCFFFKKRNSEILRGDDLIIVFKTFLTNSMCNKRFLTVKLRRIDKARELIGKLSKNLDRYIKDQEFLLLDLIKYVGGRRDSKTLVFAVKMFNYGVRICTRERIVLPFTISIPLDNRILKISYLLGVRRDVINFWNRVSKEIGIPPLHVDSLLWIAYRYARESEKSEHVKFDKLIQFLSRLMKNVRNIY